MVHSAAGQDPRHEVERPRAVAALAVAAGDLERDALLHEDRVAPAARRPQALGSEPPQRGQQLAACGSGVRPRRSARRGSPPERCSSRACRSSMSLMIAEVYRVCTRGAATVASVRIATWNVNSLKQRLPRLLPWLDERRPDVVCLQETKLADDAFAELLGDELTERGYETRRTARRRGTASRSCRASGSTTSSRASPARPGFPHPEARAVSATCGGFRVVSVYVPNGRDARLRPLPVQARVARVAARRCSRPGPMRRSSAAT